MARYGALSMKHGRCLDLQQRKDNAPTDRQKQKVINRGGIFYGKS